MMNIQGIPTPKPKIKPTITALPIVSPSRSMLKFPDRTASNKTNATIVDKISVNADSKLSIDFASSDMRSFLTNPNTMIELLPPTIVPSSMLSSHSHPKPKCANPVTIPTETANPKITKTIAKCAVFRTFPICKL